MIYNLQGYPRFSGHLSAWSPSSGVTQNQVFNSFQHQCLILFQILLILLFFYISIFFHGLSGREVRKLVFHSLSLMGIGERGLRRSFTSPSPSLANRIIALVNSSDCKHTHKFSDHLTNSLGNQRFFLAGKGSLYIRY